MTLKKFNSLITLFDQEFRFLILKHDNQDFKIYQFKLIL